MSPEELDRYLSEKYKAYAESERYGSVTQLAEGFQTTEAIPNLLQPALEATLKRPLIDTRSDLIEWCGPGSEEIVDRLLQSPNKDEFANALKQFVDHKMGELPTYEKTQAVATSKYSELLSKDTGA